MPSLIIASAIFASMLGGALLGVRFRKVIPDHHTKGDSKDILLTATTTMGTLVALIVGLLLGAAKDTFDRTSATLTQSGAKAITLDYLLGRYGTETKEARELLRNTVASGIQIIWPEKGAQQIDLAALDHVTGLKELYNKVQELEPQNALQTYLKSEALKIVAEQLQARWMFIEQSQDKLPTAFLVVLTFWLAVLFAQFGLLAPLNYTTRTMLFICAISIASAVFFIQELEQPLGGLVKIDSAPLYKALALIGK